MSTKQPPYPSDKAEFIGEVSGIPCYRFIKDALYSWDYCFDPGDEMGYWLWSSERFRGVEGDFHNQHIKFSSIPEETQHAISEFLWTYHKLSL